MRKLTLNRRTPSLAPNAKHLVLDAAAALGYHQQMTLALQMLRDYVAANDKAGAQIWADNFAKPAKRLGSWHYLNENQRASELWAGPDGWAARLLKFELELCEAETEAARAAHAVLKPVFEEIGRREIGEAYQLEVAA